MFKIAVFSRSQLMEWLHYDPLTGIFYWRVDRRRARAGDIAGCTCPDGYLRVRINYQQLCMHRVAWFYMTGEWPSRHIDHKDTNKANNKWDNLRLATVSQNSANSKIGSRNKSGFKGAYLQEGKWCARVTKESGERVFLGFFETAEEAHHAYMVALEAIHGEFARAA